MPNHDLRGLLGLRLSSDALQTYIQSLKTLVGLSRNADPAVNVYSDAVYLNYHALGLSLMLKPSSGCKPTKELSFSQIDSNKLILEEIHVYNPPSPSNDKAAHSTEHAFSPFAAIPITLSIGGFKKGPDGTEEARAEDIIITKETNGKDFVECIGEPDRKGGGSGPSSGSIGIWCEWTKDGIMVEFGGEKSCGPQAWERGKDATWKVIQLFAKSS